MRTKVALLLGLALAALPAVAGAATSHPATPANSNANAKAVATSTTGASSKASANATANAAKVTFVVHGTVTAYTAASGATNGAISITFKSSNFESALLKAAAQPLTFVVGSSTDVVLHGGKAVASGDKAIVKVRAAKTATVATLATITASQILDQGKSS
jgi:hypothetical protein